MKTKMTKVRLNFDMDKETKWLNQMAEQGWAVTGVCLGAYRLAKCEPGEYIYQMDIAEGFFCVSEGYRQFMEEMGVEIVSVWGPWVILRRKASEGVFEMYTDVESTITRYTKVRKVFQVCGTLEGAGVISGIFYAMSQRRGALGWGTAVAALAMLIMLLFLRQIAHLNGILAELNGRLGKRPSKQEGPVSAFFSGMREGTVIGLICGVALYPRLYALLHELGHCIAVWVCGGTVTGFYPFSPEPYMTFEGLTGSFPYAVVDAAGALLPLAVISAALLICKGSKKHPTLNVFLGIVSAFTISTIVPWIVVPVCGLLGVTDSREDICKFLDNSGLHPAAVILGAVMVLVLICLLFVRKIPVLFGAVSRKFIFSMEALTITLAGVITAAGFFSGAERVFAEGDFQYTAENRGDYMLQEEIVLEIRQPGEYTYYVDWEIDHEGVIGGVLLRDEEAGEQVHFGCTGNWLQVQSLPVFLDSGRYTLSFYLLGSEEDWAEYGRIAGMEAGDWEGDDMEEYDWQSDGPSKITGSYRIVFCP